MNQTVDSYHFVTAAGNASVLPSYFLSSFALSRLCHAFGAYISFGHTSPASSVSDYISGDFEAVLKQLTSTVQLGLVAMYLRAFGR